MGVKQVEAYELTCDNDKCGKIQIIALHDDDCPGYYGTARSVTLNGGSTTINWYACSNKCIANAVMDAIVRSYE